MRDDVICNKNGGKFEKQKLKSYDSFQPRVAREMSYSRIVKEGGWL